MDKTLEFLIDHGGFGSIFGIVAAWVAAVLWRRNNALQDSRSQLADEVRNLRLALDIAIKQAASDRQQTLEAVAKLEAQKREGPQ